MRHARIVQVLSVLITTAFLVSCGDSETSYPVHTYNLGERISLGHLNYQVFETQWLTHLGSGAEQRIPKNRFFLVRLGIVSNAGGEVMVPNFTVEDDNGNAYPELSEGQGVSQYIGYLRPLKSTESATGNALFDAPPRHYKLKLKDETGEKIAYVDIPLTFTSETPDVPEVGKGDKK